MPWRPEDWIEWSAEEASPALGATHLRTLNRILQRFPDPGTKALALLSCGPVQLPAVARFARVVTADLDRRGLRELTCALDVVVAIDSTVGPTRLAPVVLFTRVQRSLVEGGVLLGAFPARRAGATPIPLRGTAPDLELHEVELQYCLHRCGFQGLRIRRCDGMLICMAVRRACN